MSYESQASLRNDPVFQVRVTSSLDEQALIFKDDTRTEISQLADAQLKGGGPFGTWMSVLTAQPGIKDVPDQAAITDAQILSGVQTQWPIVANLYYAP